MVYMKKLIVLTGTGGTGTVTIERSAAGVSGRLNTYDLPETGKGRYVLAFTGGVERVIDLGESSVKRVDFTLDPKTDVSLLHCAVAKIDGDKVEILLYGTLAPRKLWIGEFADRIARRNPHSAAEQPAPRPQPTASKPAYTAPTRDIRDFFLEVVPSVGEFHDGAVVDVNYFDPAFAASTEPQAAPEPTPKPAVRETQSVAQTQADPQPVETPASAPEIRQPEPDPEPQPAVRETQPVVQARPEPQPQSPRAERETPSALERAYILRLTEQAARISAPKVSERTAIPHIGDAAATVPHPQSDSFRLARAARPKPLSFYERVKDKLGRLFAANTPCIELENLMPDTKWVKVDFDGKRYYTVGLVGARPDYVCYGVPAKYTPAPPEELDGYCSWLPVKPEEPEGDGYWVMFQDADTGEEISIKAQ